MFRLFRDEFHATLFAGLHADCLFAHLHGGETKFRQSMGTSCLFWPFHGVFLNETRLGPFLNSFQILIFFFLRLGMLRFFLTLSLTKPAYYLSSWS